MASVFISYSRQREAVARTLAADLETLGHTTWFDLGLTGGQAWWDQILMRVRDSAVFVFLLDQDSLESTACQREYIYADELGKPILPVLVADGVSTNLLPPMLARIQFVDYRSQDRNAAFRLAKAISTVPASNVLPDPLPTPPTVPISYLGSLAERIESTTTLSYEDQSATLLDLKRGMRDPKSRNDVRTLLQRLRKRRDLFANIAEEIDDLLRSAPATSMGAVRVTDAVRRVPGQLTRSGGAESARVQQGDRQGSQPSLEPLVAEPRKDRLLKERLRGAIYLGIVGMAVGLLCLIRDLQMSGPLGHLISYFSLFPWPYFAVGGLLAGAISGRDRAKMIGAGTGMAIAATSVLANYGYAGRQNYFWGAVVPPFGAVLAILARRALRKRESS